MTVGTIAKSSCTFKYVPFASRLLLSLRHASLFFCRIFVFFFLPRWFNTWPPGTNLPTMNRILRSGSFAVQSTIVGGGVFQYNLDFRYVSVSSLKHSFEKETTIETAALMAHLQGFPLTELASAKGKEGSLWCVQVTGVPGASVAQVLACATDVLYVSSLSLSPLYNTRDTTASVLFCLLSLSLTLYTTASNLIKGFSSYRRRLWSDAVLNLGDLCLSPSSFSISIPSVRPLKVSSRERSRCLFRACYYDCAPVSSDVGASMKRRKSSSGSRIQVR